VYSTHIYPEVASGYVSEVQELESYTAQLELKKNCISAKAVTGIHNTHKNINNCFM
jgi:hypothetical protein